MDNGRRRLQCLRAPEGVRVEWRTQHGLWYWRCVMRKNVAPCLLGSALCLSLGCRSPEFTAGAGVELATEPSSAVAWPRSGGAEYEFSIESGVALPGAQELSYTWTGLLRLWVRPLERGAGELELQLAGVRMTVQGGSAEALGAQKAALEEPIRVRYRDGTIESLTVGAESTPEAVNVQRILAAALQYSPEAPGATAGAVKHLEFDGTGAYWANYRLEGDTLRRVKTSYENLLTRVDSGVSLERGDAPKVVLSDGRITWSEGRWLHVEQNDTLSVTMTGAAETRVRTRIVLDRKPGGPTGPLVLSGALDGGQRIGGRDAFLPAPRPSTAFDAARIRGLTLDIAMQDLASAVAARNAADRSPDRGASRAEELLQAMQAAVSTLSALARSDPKHVSTLEARVHAGDELGPHYVNALGAVGTPEAQEALGRISADTKRSKRERQVALRHLVRSDTPSADTLALLPTLLNDPVLSDTALYGLGSAVRRAPDSEARRQAIQILRDRLRGAKSDRARVDALNAISNTGMVEFRDAILDQWTRPDPGVRSAAVQAVRLMPEEATNQILVYGLGAAEGTVRAMALDVLSKQRPRSEVAAGVRRVLSADPNAAVRAKALQVAIAWLPERPEIRAWLLQVEAEEADEAMRILARNALAAGRGLPAGLPGPTSDAAPNGSL